MVKYFETLYNHPQTQEEVTVYCKAVLGEESTVKVYAVYTGEEYPFVITFTMIKQAVELSESIQKNFYKDMCNYINNLFG